MLAVASGTGATIAAAMLLGLAGIAFVSLVFLIVGQGEEADRRRNPRGEARGGPRLARPRRERRDQPA